MIRIATWNINSIRLRIDIVRRFTEEYAPDILCLQETKVQDKDFPLGEVQGMGYEHVVFRGEKSYNGVAILSRIPLSEPSHKLWAGKQDCRHLAVGLPGGLELHNFYVPAGGDIPDPDQNDKFAHKLAFLDEMRDWFRKEKPLDGPSILVGDLNIAPLEHDVWSHKKLLDVVSHTPVEVEKFGSVMDAFGWVDVMRNFVPTDEKLYTWWSYRARDWEAADKGRRLDHVWATAPVAPKAKAMQVVKAARGWEKPSDHAPVIVEFDWPKA